MTAIKEYSQTKKSKVVHAVTELCKQLQRPVNSQDIKKYFQNNAAADPLYKQRWGQVLIKCSRPYLWHPRIYPMGIFKNRAFYAPECSSRWRKAFHKHVATMLLAQLEKTNIPSYSYYLSSRPDPLYAQLGARALALYDQEIKWLKCCVANGKSPFAYMGKIQFCEEELWTRNETKVYLKQQLLTRRQHNISLCRILAQLRWPQSCLYQQATGDPVYLPDQVKCRIEAKYPAGGEDPLLADAACACLRYALVSGAARKIVLQC